MSAMSADSKWILDAYWECKDFETSSRMKGMEKATRILGFEFEVQSPHDQETGHTTGRVRMSPFKISKFVDKSSPLEVQALVTNKLINECKISYYAVNQVGQAGAANAGGARVKQFELTFSKFVLIGVHQVAGADSSGVTETIEFTYDKFVMLDVPSTKQAEHEWTQGIS